MTKGGKFMNEMNSPLLTDLYQLTMLKGYYDRGMEEEAVFEFFVRNLPSHRGFLVACGLQAVLEFLENFKFTDNDINILNNLGLFNDGFLDYLKNMRFTGHVTAMEEGTIFFPNEPILRITAPLPQAQFVESRIINILHFQTLIASKAVRIVLSAPEKILVDFGMRRAHGAEAAMFSARASYIAGFSGTATVLANALYGIPVYGTMAHSFVLANDNEIDAFENFADSFPDNSVFILDTYDTAKAAEKVVQLSKKGIKANGVRLDSGDLVSLSKTVRQILDAGGLKDTKIFASGNLDEYSLSELLQANAAIDGFGVGTKMDTSADLPYLDSAYKLQYYNGKFRRKRSIGKETLPGIKQVYRYFDNDNFMSFDVITTEEDVQQGKPLLKPVMLSGKPLNLPADIFELRKNTSAALLTLPQIYKKLTNCPKYPVLMASAITELIKELDSIDISGTE
jgi:nicotinate phosphoribosyltransferase